MRGRAIWEFGSAALLLMLTSQVAHAQCTKDTDCKGDRVCEAGVCTSPLPAAPPAPPDAKPGAAAAQDAPSSGQALPPPSGVAVLTPAEPALGDQRGAAAPGATAPLPDEPRFERRSRTAMVAGIIMVSVGPLALLGALSAKNSQESCDDQLARDYPSHRLPSSERYRKEECDSYTVPLYVLGIGGASLSLGGIPLIIYGAKKQPRPPQAAQLRVLPWATHDSGGLQLRLDL
jgi:hypothetical protein